MDRPNIIFVFPDQWRGDSLSRLGHPVVETPFLDELSHQGICFTGAYTPSPTCIAARAALATGMSPSSAGRMGYRDGVPWTYPNTFMRLMRDSGYQTICVGKTHFYPTRAHLGFEELELYEMPYQDWHHPSDYHTWLRDKTNGQVQDTAVSLDSNCMIVHPWTAPEEYHPNSWTVTRAIEAMERRDTLRPFFMQLNFHRPHPPLDPVMSYYERYLEKELPPVPVGDWAKDNDEPVKQIAPSQGTFPEAVLDRARRAYYAQLSHIDFQIGRLMRFLRGRKLLDNTWIVFASDHGELLGDHHMYRKTNGFEGSAHIPMIVRPPQGHQFDSGVVCGKPVSLQDLAPTFLDLAQIDHPDEMEADSLLPLITDVMAPWKEFVHGEHTPCWQFVTDGKEKLIWDTVDDRRWFFDLTNDPQELRNLAAVAGAAERMKVWENRLVGVLEARPQDGFTSQGVLTPGRSIPAVRERLVNQSS